MASRPPKIPLPRDLDRVNRGLDDMGAKLTNISRGWAGQMQDVAGNAEDIAHKIERIAEAAGKAGGATADQAKEVTRLNKELEKTTSAWKNISKFVGSTMVGAFDRFGKGLISTGFAFFEKGLAGMYEQLEKVHELFERWTGAIGRLNMRIGSLSPNMRGFTKEAKKWEGTIRGLTDQFGAGLQMAQDFAEGFGRILPEEELAKWGKLGLGIARGLGLGGQSAGEFLKSMYQLGQSSKDTTDTFGDIISGAKAAGISVNLFSKEVVESRGFMVSFGKEGQKAFLTSAAFAKKLGISLKSLQAFTKTTDTFDATTAAVAKLNTVFGSTISSLDLILEDDPGKRFEKVRQGLLAQGKTFDQISRQERNLIGETLNLSEEEVAGMLKSGDTLEEFREKQEKARAKQAKTEALIRKATAATAETMFAFGAAIDRLTTKTIKLIRPFTDMLGLTKEGGKDAKSFGQVMGSVFGKIGDLIDKTAKNKDFIAFMKRMADHTKEFFRWVDRVAKSGELQKWIGKAVKGAQDFLKGVVMVGKQLYDVFTSGPVKGAFSFVLDHIREIIATWGLMKVAIGGYDTLKMFKRGFDALQSVRGIGPASGGGGVGSLIGPQAPQASSSKLAGVAGTAAAAAAAAAAGAAGFTVGSIVNEAFAYIRSDGRSLSDLIADVMPNNARKGVEQKGADWEARYKQLKDASRKSGDRTELNKFLGVDSLQKVWEQQAEKQKLIDNERVKKGRDAEALVQTHLKGTLKKEDVFQKELFQLKLQDYLRGKATEAGYQGDVDSDFEKLMGHGGEEMLQTAKGTRNFVNTILDRIGPAQAVATAAPQANTRVTAPPRGGASPSAKPSAAGAAPAGAPTVVAGDVYLDGAKVGKHMVRHLVGREH